MRKTRASLAAIAVLVSACAPAELAETSASRSPTPTLTATESPIPTATMSAAPPVSVAPTPRATASESPTPSLFGAAVFAEPDDCVNPVGGYRVAYPDDWYSNAGVENPLNPAGEDIAPCWLFAPADFEVIYGTEIPADVAVVIRRFDAWDYGPWSGNVILSDVRATIAGHPARIQEREITERTIAFAPGQRVAQHIVELPDGSYLVAETYLGPDYESARTVLDDMMQTLELVSP